MSGNRPEDDSDLPETEEEADARCRRQANQAARESRIGDLLDAISDADLCKGERHCDGKHCGLCNQGLSCCECDWCCIVDMAQAITHED